MSTATGGPAMPLAIYIHWPFCLSKCPYCDFNSHVRETINTARWERALSAELDHFAATLPSRRVASIFFGGGTPSLMPPRLVEAIIDRAAGHWRLDAEAEITLEANPTSTEAGRLREIHAAGVNRVSLGVQALDDDALRFLGRGHSAVEARRAVAEAQRIFPRCSFDMIYARPGQDGPQWRAELTEALAMAGDHVSLYQLTIERGTPFYAAARDGAFKVPDDDDARTLFDITQEMTEVAGFPAYEISNHARRGGESRHNLAYWRSAPYVGIGPGAHGRLDLGGGWQTTRQHAAPEAWLDAVEQAGHGTVERRTLEPSERAAEMVMMGLRLAAGLSLHDIEVRTGLGRTQFIRANRVAALQAAGLVEQAGAMLRTTARGRPLLQAILAEVLV